MAADREKILQAAQKLVEKKRFDKAIVEYQKLVADDPKDVRTLLKIGDLYLKLEQHVDAIATYERVGQFYSAQGFHAKTIAVFKQIREIIHKHVPHLEDRFGHIVPKLAETYVQLGLVSDALASYDEVATRYQRAGRDRDAIDVFRKVVDLDPQNPLPHLRLAEAFIRVKDVDNAIQRFGTAAEILLRLGRKDDVLKVVERLLQHRQDTKFARIAAEIYLDRREPADAMAALSKLQICFKENPKDLETLALLARAFDKLGQPAKAIEVQKEAARIAREAGKFEHFDVLVDVLAARAPNDEGVRHFVALRREGRPAPRPPLPSVVKPDAPPAPAKLEVVEDASEDVILDDDDEGTAAVPFPLAGGAEAAPTAVLTASTALPAAPPTPAARLRQILQQVDGFRHAKNYDHAIARLFEGIEEQPTARELREKLCDIYIEAGDQAEAVHQMLEFARWLTAGNEIDDATRILDEVLLLEPDQVEALAMLRDLGYAVPTDQGGYAEGEQTAYDPNPYAEQAHAASHVAHVSDHAPPDAGSGYDPQAPLPSYDLEETSAVDATLVASSAQVGSPVGGGAELDDPFAEAPLPAFDLDDEATRYRAYQPSLVGEPGRGSPSPSGQLGEAMEAAAASAANYGGAARAEEAPPPPPAPAAQLDEDALEEVEFFATNSMFDEARALLEAELARLPNHPLLLERLRELEEHAAAAQGGASGTLVVPRSGAPAAHSAEDKSFDIAASLDALDALDAGPPSAVGATDPHDPSQVSVEAVFQQFKAGVAAQISESDAATHYDLGAAYKEMGLTADAIGEFELASRDPGRECVCLWMIGMIHRETGHLAAAIDSFIRGTKARVRTPEQEIALTYEVADCHEAMRQLDQARYYFDRAVRMNPAYDDPRGSAADRLRRLEPVPIAKPAAKAVGADTADEFDAALDDLIGKTKLN